MKVSLNWVKEFTQIDLSIEELVEKIGAQLGEVKAVVNLGERYKRIIVAKVVKCDKLEGSDHLSICLIDDGGNTPDVNRVENGYVQVVCGAPNVQVGMLVAWLPPGSTVPASYDSEPFVLTVREFRGVVSNGMLASAKELAIGDSHEGLLPLDQGNPGDDFAEVYELHDFIIDIENKMFTHRPDCFGMLGVAREIAGICGQRFASPDWYKQAAKLPHGEGLPLEVRNELPKLAPRFMAVAIKGITVGPSPIWLQTYLSRVGVRPINNIVDVTNYMMLLTGQPLHAYDYDKVKALSENDVATIVVRNPHSDEKLTLLNGKEITPRPEAILIATDKQAIGLGGVMGGAETEVGADTKNIILECASFDMYSIRRTSMAHGIFSDAVTRFNKGQSPLQNDRVLAESVATILNVSKEAKVASETIDDNHVEPGDLERGNLYPAVTISIKYINDRLGLALNADAMKTLLQNVEFIVEEAGENLVVNSPFWRTDIELREDVVEEVARLYGFDKLPLELPKRDVTPVQKDALLETKASVRDVLSKAGANEVLTYSFVHGNLLEKAGQDTAQAFELSNALSPDLQYYRLSLTPSLLEKVHPNVKAGYDQFALFEIGTAHGKSEVDEDGLPRPFGRVALVFVADSKIAKQQYEGAAYYQARKYLGQVANGELTCVPLETETFKDHKLFMQLVAIYEPNRSALVMRNGKLAGIIGEFKPSVVRAYKLPKFSAGFELFISALKQQLEQTGKNYTVLPRFPKVSQDVSLKIPASMPYQDLYDFVSAELGKIKPENSLPTLGPVDIYQGEDKEHKNVTLRLAIASYEKTLTDQEVNTLLDMVAIRASEKFGAERV